MQVLCRYPDQHQGYVGIGLVVILIQRFPRCISRIVPIEVNLMGEHPFSLHWDPKCWGRKMMKLAYLAEIMMLSVSSIVPECAILNEPNIVALFLRNFSHASYYNRTKLTALFTQYKEIEEG